MIDILLGALVSINLVALANIIFIDLVMSGDNAILIGMATRKLTGKQRKQAIIFGIAAATVLRIIFSLLTVYLLAIPGLKFFGGLLLTWVVYNFFCDLRHKKEYAENTTNAPVPNAFWPAIWTIIIADVSMSLDNVLAVAGAAHGDFTLLVIGLVVSILFMAFASGAIARLLDRYPVIAWIGLTVIVYVTAEMLWVGGREVVGFLQ